jgi:iron-sulfur cluster repair protein YtfE (RIC family)
VKNVISNGERRVQILAQHAGLRRMVHALLDTAARVEDGEDSRGDVLRARIVMLRFELERHLLDEEDLLEPVFARTDGTGAPFLARMNLEHARQRASLGTLHVDLGARVSLRAVAAKAGAMCRALLDEMDEEEEHLLSLEALGRPAMLRTEQRGTS